MWILGLKGLTGFWSFDEEIRVFKNLFMLSVRISSY